MSVEDEGLFASTDARYRGKGLVPKAGTKVKAKFNTPLSSNKGTKRVSIKCDTNSKKGEKEKGNLGAGAVGGVVGDSGAIGGVVGGASAVGDVVGDGGVDSPHEKEKITKEKLHVYCRHLGDGRGEC